MALFRLISSTGSLRNPSDARQSSLATTLQIQLEPVCHWICCGIIDIEQSGVSVG
jgi:hypothetical protein